MVLTGWTEDKIIPLSPEEIISMIDKVTKSGAYAALRKFLDVLDNCGLLAARLPHGIFNSVYKFHNTEKERTVLDKYPMCMTSRYYEALKMLNTYVQQSHVPLLGVNAVNALIKNTGLSLHKYKGFALVEGQAVEEQTNDNDYPSAHYLLNLCGLSLSAKEQIQKVCYLLAPLSENFIT